MKKIRKLLLVTLAAALCALLLTGLRRTGAGGVGVRHAGQPQRACDISSISITPSTSTEWDTEYVDGVVRRRREHRAPDLAPTRSPRFPDTYNIHGLQRRGLPSCTTPASMSWTIRAARRSTHIDLPAARGRRAHRRSSRDYDPAAYDTEDECDRRSRTAGAS